MLQMNCPNCSAVIVSPLLAEVPVIECGKCQATVEVKDVFVTTKNFTIHRQDLINRIYRYQSLLKEVEKERQLMAGNEAASEKTKRSINQFYATLQELLAGARKNFRLVITGELPIEMHLGTRCSKGKVLNLSSEGASIGFRELDALPKHRAEVELHLSLPEVVEVLPINARVVWTRKMVNDDTSQWIIVGVNFPNLDETMRNHIWNFIITAASA